MAVQDFRSERRRQGQGGPGTGAAAPSRLRGGALTLDEEAGRTGFGHSGVRGNLRISMDLATVQPARALPREGNQGGVAGNSFTGEPGFTRRPSQDSFPKRPMSRQRA
jgi:hypothetical protein